MGGRRLLVDRTVKAGCRRPSDSLSGVAALAMVAAARIARHGRVERREQAGRIVLPEPEVERKNAGIWYRFGSPVDMNIWPNKVGIADPWASIQGPWNVTYSSATRWSLPCRSGA